MTVSAPQRTLRLLIVDDHQDSARALSRLLRHDGHLVATAHTVTGALSLLVGQRPIDVLVSDIALPDGDGCELLKKVRALYGGRDVAAVALSGIGDDAVVERCGAAGYRQFLFKPVTFEQVAEAIRVVCQSFPPAATTSAAPVVTAPPLRQVGGVPAPLAGD
jgi:two-component system CheB/CheR fusion protein